jgi:hypothetical protein
MLRILPDVGLTEKNYIRWNLDALLSTTKDRYLQLGGPLHETTSPVDVNRAVLELAKHGYMSLIFVAIVYSS